MATVDPNTSNVQLIQPVDFRQSVPGSTNADDFARLASPALVYDSNTVNVQPLGETTIGFTQVPSSIQLQVAWNGGAFGSATTFQTTGHSATDVYLLAGQYVPGSTLATGLYQWQFKITASPIGSGTSNLADFPVISNDSGPFGAGWSVSGVDHLYVNSTDSDVMWAFGANASPAVFTFNTTTQKYTDPPNLHGTLAKSGSGYTYTSEHLVTYTFDSGGKLTSITDPHNLAVTYTYNASNLVSTIQQPDGGVTTFSYNGSNQLTQLSEPGNRSLTFAYDGSDNLTSTTDSDGTTRSYGYDSNHKLTSVNWAPLTSLYSYSLTNAAARGLQTNPALSSSSQGLATFTDALNQLSTFTMDFLGYVTKWQSPDGATQKWTRPSAEKPATYTDALNRVTTFAYASNGYDLTQVTYADGNTTQYQYNSTFDWPTVQVDENGNRTTFSYDGTTGDLTSVQDALGNLTSYTYVQSGGRSNGLVQTAKDQLGHVTSFAYDTSRRLTQTTDALNELTTFTYDAAGNEATVKDALGHVTSYAYDARRRLTQTTDATGGITTMLYNGLGEVTKQVDAVGNTTTFAYDGKGLLTSETDAAGSSVSRQISSAYDGLGRMTSQTDALNHTTTYAYDPVGRLTQTTNALGGLATNVYDAAGELSYRKDELGTITSFAYDLRGRQTKVIEAYGSSVQRTATMAYDKAGNLLSETTGGSSSNQQLVTTSYGYDALNRQTKVIEGYGSGAQRTATMVFDAAGNLTSETTGAASSNQQLVTTSYGYDALNRQTQVIEANGVAGVQRSTTMIFDKAGNLLSETTGQSSTASYAHQATTSYAYDAANRQTAVLEAFGTSLQRTTTTVYDSAGKVSSVTDPLGHVASYAYDALNRQTQVVEAVGASVQRTATMLYDAADNLTSETTGIATSNQQKVTTSYAYDALNRRTETLDAYGSSAQTTATTLYDAVGNVTSETTGYSSTAGYSNPLTTSYGYDALYRQTAVLDAYGTSIQRTATTVYDSADNVIQSIDAAGFTTTYAYDGLNRQTTMQTPAGGTVTSVYDSADNLLAQTDQLGHTTSHAYDALNRETVTTDPRGGLTTYTYDAAGNQLTLTDPVNNKTTFQYDTLNRLTQQTDPLGHSATFVYNAGDLLTSTTDRDGRVRNLSYDALNRQTGATWVVSGSTVNTQTFTYDSADNQLTAQDANGTYTMGYDALNRMTSEQEPFAQVLTFSYDAASNRTSVQDSQSGYTTSVYDALDRLTSRQFSNGTTNLRIDPGWTNRDQLASLKRYTDLGGTSLVGMSSYTYDGAMRLSNLTHTYASGSVLASYAYGYDQASRLTSETVDGSNTTYGYDATDQLTTVNGTATYSYDLNGNRTMTGYATGTGNELTNDGTYTYTYDNEGNLTQKSKGSGLETWYYGYDSMNRLTSVRKTSDGTANQVTATYTYDVFGNRIEQDEWVKPGSGNGVTTVTRFAYDGQNVWADLNSSNALTMRRLYLDGVDQPFARVDSNNVAAWYLTDHLGSVRDLMDKAGATDLDHIAYDAYGNISSESSTTNGDRYKYTAREWDGNTGLQYNRARYYDPRIGRWINQDPIGFLARDANFYRYVRNTPLDVADVFGLAPTLSARTSFASKTGPWGSLMWGITWHLSEPAKEEGYIIQAVGINDNLFTVFGWPWPHPDKQRSDFFEAWHVSKGKQEPDPGQARNARPLNIAGALTFNIMQGFTPSPGSVIWGIFAHAAEFAATLGLADDWYTNSPLLGMIGTLELMGAAEFIQGMTPEELEALGFRENNPNTRAGPLPSVEAEPMDQFGKPIFLPRYWACPSTPPGVGDATTVDEALMRHQWYGDVSNVVAHNITITWTNGRNAKVIAQTPGN